MIKAKCSMRSLVASGVGGTLSTKLNPASFLRLDMQYGGLQCSLSIFRRLYEKFRDSLSHCNQLSGDCRRPHSPREIFVCYQSVTQGVDTTETRTSTLILARMNADVAISKDNLICVHLALPSGL